MLTELLPFSEMCLFDADIETCRSAYKVRTGFLVIHFDQNSDTSRNIGLLALKTLDANASPRIFIKLSPKKVVDYTGYTLKCPQCSLHISEVYLINLLDVVHTEMHRLLGIYIGNYPCSQVYLIRR